MGFEGFYNWRDPKISDWKKLLRITFTHGWKDINCRGISAREAAKRILERHKKDLTKEELEFVRSCLV